MWMFLKVLGILTIVLNSKAVPKEYHGLQHPKLKIATEPEIERLSRDITPENYQLEVTVTEEDLDKCEFSGLVTILLSVQNATTTFKIHAKDIAIDRSDANAIMLTAENYTGTIAASEADPLSDLVTITSDEKIPRGSATLSIVYAGKLNIRNMDGFYRSSYNEGDENIYLATTQFEAKSARRAFPCFDEPSFKATFDITIKYPDGYRAMSNMPPSIGEQPAGNDLKRITFRRTPKMSSYLVAFVVSKLYCEDGDEADGAAPIQTSICARPGTSKTMAYAKTVAPQALIVMRDYTQLDYSLMGIGKMTQVAIPDFAFAAMENWGMVTYREADVLWDEQESSNYDKQLVTTTIVHEFSHQWFGNYITLNWWNNAFLNEGFATYFEYHAADLIEPTWELTKQFVIEQLQPVLVTDSNINSKALTFLPTKYSEILNKFDDITYKKGGAILRMVEHVLGRENFIKGLADYLNNYAKDIVTPDFLWAAFQNYTPTVEPQKLPENAPLEKIMNNWVNQPGYPILTVTLAKDGKSATVTQKRFSMPDGNDTYSRWYVPITYITNKNNDVNETATQAWLTPYSFLKIDLKDEVDWIILNKQQIGFYRVIYDSKIEKKIKEALIANVEAIDEISRSQLVDDQLNFARAGVKNYSEVLDFLTFLKNDTSYYSWTSALRGFSHLLQQISHSEVEKALNEYVIELMDALLKSVPVEIELKDQQIYTLKQALALKISCIYVKNEDCVKNATVRFVNYKNAIAKVNPNWRNTVYCTGLRNSENPTSDYNFLYDEYKASQLATEKVVILKSLGCVNDSTLRHKYLQTSLTDEIRIQDVTYVFSSVYANSPDGVNDTLDFIQTNYTNFEERFGTKSTLKNLIREVSKYITTQYQLDKLTNFLNTEDLDSDIKEIATSSWTSAYKSLESVVKLEDTLKSYFQPIRIEGTSSATTNIFYLLNLALISFMHLIFNM